MGRRKVLVVDDLKDNADTLRLILAFRGHDVRVCYSGSEAITLAAEFRPDYILMDIGMPEMDGCAACQEIRKTDWGRSVNIFAVSGWGQPKDVDRSMAAGFDRHYVKPLTGETIQYLIE